MRGVSRHWSDTPVLHNITLRIRAGERVALIGPSGAGKSTLIRLMAGALRPTGGSIEIAGRPMADFSWADLQGYRSQCRIIEQQSCLVPQSSVHSNVVSGLLSTWSWHKALIAALMPMESARVHAVLQQLGIAEHQWSRADELSGGQIQRVAIARALIANPVLLLADEPTASLDPSTAKSVTQQIVDVAKQRGMSLVFCTHWLDIVKNDCTRVIGLRAGEVLFDALPALVTAADLERLYAGSHQPT